MRQSRRTPRAAGSSASSSRLRVPRGRASELGLRVLTAAVGIPIVLTINYVGSWPFAVLIDIVAIVAALECARLLAVTDTLDILLAAAAAAVIATLPMAISTPERAWISVLVAVVAISGVRSLAPRPRHGQPRDWTHAVFPALYVGVPLGILHLLRHAPRGAWWILILLLITWAYDTGAFAAGSLYGRHPFMQHISAKKTREGVAGGLLLSTAVALLAIPAVHLPVWQALIMGLLGGAVAQIGDLVESSMKRQVGLKDSGTIIPGHGGLLDRIDSLLWTSVLVYAIAAATGHAT